MPPLSELAMLVVLGALFSAGGILLQLHIYDLILPPPEDWDQEPW